MLPMVETHAFLWRSAERPKYFQLVPGSCSLMLFSIKTRASLEMTDSRPGREENSLAWGILCQIS